MRSLHLTVAAIAATTAPLFAQNPLGTFTGTSVVSSVSRVFRAEREEILQRVDASDYAGIGVDAASPGTISLTGIRFVVFDFISATPDPVHAIIRTQGATNNLPDVSNPPAFRSAALTIPPNAGGNGGLFDLSFATPVTVPAGNDVFVGVELPPETAVTGNDAVWVYAFNGIASGTFRDIGGPAIDTTSNFTDTYRHAFRISGPMPGVFNITRGQWLIEPRVLGAGGAPTAVTNQTTLTSSNAAPGVASPMSGLHPDVNGFNAGRADDPGFIFIDAAYASQNVFFILSGLGIAATPTPLGAIVPGSTGSYCFNDLSGGAAVAAIVADANGVAAVNLPLDAAARAALGGTNLGLAWAAVGFNGTTFSGSPCAVQTY